MVVADVLEQTPLINTGTTCSVDIDTDPGVVVLEERQTGRISSGRVERTHEVRIVLVEPPRPDRGVGRSSSGQTVQSTLHVEEAFLGNRLPGDRVEVGRIRHTVATYGLTS